MNTKILAATIFTKNGSVIKSAEDFTVVGDYKNIVKIYNDSGIDRLIINDLSEDDAEMEATLHLVKEINRKMEIPTAVSGNLRRFDDVKHLIYAGCSKVIFNGSKPETLELSKECASRFGAERLSLCLYNVDFLFKNAKLLPDIFSEIIAMDFSLCDTIDNLAKIPYIVKYDDGEYDVIKKYLSKIRVTGMCGAFIDNPDFDVMPLKNRLSNDGLTMNKLNPAISFDELKTDEKGLIPCVVQDYNTDDVLMVAYMNKESFEQTLLTGRMTYWSRSRNELWEKGATSGHFQYVKSLTTDCDNDTILAKVSQIGAACHTGARSCFFNEIVKKDCFNKNPMHVFEDVYSVIADRKINPKEGSYTNYLFEKGIDKILKKVGEEATEIVIAAKNPDPEEIKYEASDFLYHLMVLMVEKGITWEDITSELSQR